MNLVLIFGVAAVLLLLLWAVARRQNEEAAGPPDPSEYLVRLPPPALLAKCFAVEDVRFAASLGSRPVLQLLLRERKRLALQWLRLTRAEARRLYRLHVRSARHAPDLQPSAEGRLLVHFGLFLLVYHMMTGLVLFYGPLRAQALIRSIESLANVLSALGGRIGEIVAPASVASASVVPGR